MSRCEYCRYIASWACLHSDLPEDKLCEDFDLRFEMLTDEEQKKIQKHLMSQNV